MRMRKHVIDSDGYVTTHCIPTSYYVASQRKTFFVWQDSDDRILACVFDHATEAIDPIVEVDDASDIGHDFHYCPAIGFLTNGKIVLVYGCHGSQPKYKVSANAYDIGSWSARGTVNTRNHTYPQLITFSDRLVLFVRHEVSGTQSTWERYQTTSTSYPLSWGSPTEEVNYGDGYSPYAIFQLRDGDKIFYSACVENESTNDFEDIFFAYSEDKGLNWKGVDGTSFGTSVGYAQSKVYTIGHWVAYRVYSNLDENGKPIIMFPWFDGTDFTTCRMYLGQYSVALGSSGSWNFAKITKSNGSTEWVGLGAPNVYICKEYGRPAYWGTADITATASAWKGYTGKFVRMAGYTHRFEKKYEDNTRYRGWLWAFTVEPDGSYEPPIEHFSHEIYPTLA